MAGIEILELLRAEIAQRGVETAAILQLLTRRHTVRKSVTRSRSSTLGILGPGAPFAFMS